ncbi:TetR/AcrR family transcriptional regulator [[Mycobacterium] nativiensis]|uniref:TetR/AcrR family transcriptional regulator n=1 Tax=[Mycobacterium] nativiensis TaxID=2855503 RepID=A0ABU5XWJ9_9MYCO|nr:TetR/AcrR family transcriptional regulator [Mycolicibacter sp. MYC340]MEB3031376.1 TetR/AcrR family transcriptional regulator [Mycolicibacter sp. MYC340]
MAKQSDVPLVGRTYQGLALQERRSQRRAAIVAAGLEVFGTLGYAASSVKTICGVAGLTERYFYESFTDRESCLTEVYSQLVEQMGAATRAAVEAADADVDAQAQAGLRAFIGYLTDDPRRARTVLVEVVGVSPAMEQRRHGVLAGFADLIVAVWAASRSEPLTQRERLTAVALVGAVNHLLVDWLMTGGGQSSAELADICATLFSAARDRLEGALKPGTAPPPD